LLKLGLSFYSGRVAERVRSKAVKADARDHLTDAVASAVVIGGILGARLGYPALDSLGALIVAGFIVYTAFEVFSEAAMELMETNISDDERDEMVRTVEEVCGAESVTGLAGRTLADSTLVEVHLDLDPDMTVGQAAVIADEVKRRLMTGRPDVTNVIVEMNSAMDEPHGIAVRRPPSA
jgi:cation diffusion facilitator family transporter